MTSDSLTLHALELLGRGHALYCADNRDTGPVGSPVKLERRAQRLIGVTTCTGMRSVAAPTLRLTADLRTASATETVLASLLADARTDHVRGRHGTRTVLDDAYGDSVAAVDTLLVRREALRRKAARLLARRRYIHRSSRLAHVIVLRMRRLGYPHRHPVSHVRHVSTARAIPLSAVRYDRSFTSGHVRERIAAGLNHLGVTDPEARRNWLRGYQTLIARESGSRPSAVAPDPATSAGPRQPDGYGLGYARGITQTIPVTFARYHQSGTSTNIYDPVANICASMNYVIHRYGVRPDGASLLGLVEQAEMHRPPKGY